MGHNEKQEYLKALLARYKTGKRADKTKILDEFCAVCGLNRKYAIRMLNTPRRRPGLKKTGPKPRYNAPELIQALKTIWFAADQPCSRKLKVILPEWLPSYEAQYGFLTEDCRKNLLQMSRATLDRTLAPIRARHKSKGRCTTRPGTLLKNKIPLKMDQWNEKEPGFMEADTVAHCGNSIAENFVWSLTMTDIATTWTENRATWNKGQEGVHRCIQEVEKAIPFKLLGFDCDNGTEFLNHHLQRYFEQQQVQFTRSRPYRKNDNAHVEQKNWTHVRHLFGYDRFEDPKIVDLMNDLYANAWSPYQNYFMPSMKLATKLRIGSKIKKTYEIPKTPFQRVLEAPSIPEPIKIALIERKKSLNPFTLKADIESKLRNIFKLVIVTSNLRQRL